MKEREKERKGKVKGENVMDAWDGKQKRNGWVVEEGERVRRRKGKSDGCMRRNNEKEKNEVRWYDVIDNH